MQPLTVVSDQEAPAKDEVVVAPESEQPRPGKLDDEALMAMPLTEAKRLAAAEFERRYLVRVMALAGSVTQGARLAGLDRTNFRRLLHRHGLRLKERP